MTSLLKLALLDYGGEESYYESTLKESEMIKYRITWKSGSEQTVSGWNVKHALRLAGYDPSVYIGRVRLVNGAPYDTCAPVSQKKSIRSIVTESDSTGHSVTFYFTDHNSVKWNNVSDNLLDIIHAAQRALAGVKARTTTTEQLRKG